MKYYIYAKILGDFLPYGKPVKLNNCKIEKDETFFLLRDIPQIPVINPASIYHVVKQGVNGFIQYPQEPISVRYFESDYLISTVIDNEDNLYHVLQAAEERFTQTVATLSLILKSTVKKVPGRRLPRHGYYDFETIGIFIKKRNGLRGRLIRIKMPEPLISHHNFFPEPLSKSFLRKVRKTLSVKDSVFQKGLEYIIKASRMRYSGNSSNLEVVLNFVKCIELISASVDIPKIRDKKTKKLRNPYTKELFELAGRKLRVKQKNWKFAKQAWDARNVGDVAHQSLWDWRDFPLSYASLDEAANDYLLKYLKWVTKP